MCKIHIITQSKIWDPPEVVNTAFLGSCRKCMSHFQCIHPVYVDVKANRGRTATQSYLEMVENRYKLSETPVFILPLLHTFGCVASSVLGAFTPSVQLGQAGECQLPVLFQVNCCWGRM